MWREIILLRSLALVGVFALVAVGQASNPGFRDARQRDTAPKVDAARGVETAPVTAETTTDSQASPPEAVGALPDAILASPVRVYFNNFDDPAFLASGVTGGVTLAGAAEPVQGYDGLGQAGNQFAGKLWRNTTTGNPAQKTRLILSGLPAHRSINLRFLLAIIDTWDGTSGGTNYPDYFNVVMMNTVSVFSKTFDNGTLSDQSYVPPPGGQLTYGTQRGFNTSYNDAAYDMTVDPTFAGIPHSASILAIDFFASGGGWEGGTNESWAIENLEVLISDVGPEPGPPFTDAISREVSVYMPPRSPTITDAISREVSVLAYDGPHPAFTDAVSREVSVFAVAPAVELTDAISREVSVFSVLPITLGTPYDGVLAPGNYLFFRVNTPANLTLRIDLDHASTTAWTELYASFGHVPDTFNAEFSSESPGQPDQELVVPNTQSGTYYILARCTTDSNASASKNFRLTAAALSFGLRSVEPDFMGAGVATVQINAARLTPNTSFALVDPDTRQSYPPVRVQLLNAATALGTFDMTGAPLKRFDVVAREPGLPDALLGAALQVAPATDIRFLDVRVELPSRIRGGRPTDGTVYVTNKGNVDIPVVEVPVFSPNDPRVLLSAPGFEGVVAEPAQSGLNMGFSFIMSALRPKETRRVSIIITASTQFPAHGKIPVVAEAQPYTLEDFLNTRIFEISERTRLAILAQPDHTVSVAELSIPDELRRAAEDAQEWWRRVRDGAENIVRNCLGDAACVSCLMGCLVACAPAELACGPPCHLACDVICHFPCEWCVEGGCHDAVYACQGLGATTELQNTSAVGTGGSGGGACIDDVVQSGDPNEKAGAAGYGEQGFVGARHPALYHVAFENIPAATAPAAEIRITDQLDPSLDASSFRLRRIQFGDHRVDVPEGRSSIDTIVQLPPAPGQAPEDALLVQITGGIDVAQRKATWTLQALDPHTRQLPADPTLGFLPPNNVDECGDPPHCGEGFVEFTIKPNASTPTGTVVKNKASIIFDYNDPIETNEVSNTIDSGAPTSSVAALATESLTPFVVRWNGQDDAGGSGIANYSVSLKTDAGAFGPWRSSAGTWGYFTGEVGKTYAFYTVATDNVGNVEALPLQPDSTTTITGRWVDCLAGPGAQPPPGCATADLDGDSDVDLKDVAALQLGVVPAPPP
jgi:hypothetical protein